LNNSNNKNFKKNPIDFNTDLNIEIRQNNIFSSNSIYNVNLYNVGLNRSYSFHCYHNNISNDYFKKSFKQSLNLTIQYYLKIFVPKIIKYLLEDIKKINEKLIFNEKISIKEKSLREQYMSELIEKQNLIKKFIFLRNEFIFKKNFTFNLSNDFIFFIDSKEVFNKFHLSSFDNVFLDNMEKFGFMLINNKNLNIIDNNINVSFF